MEDLTDGFAKRILLLLKLDSKRLITKIVTREDQYISSLCVKRTRNHFPKIFENSYRNTPLKELKNCSTEVIEALFAFYNIVDDMEWYLTYTEDLPGLMTSKIDHYIQILSSCHLDLLRAINLQLGIEEVLSEFKLSEDDEQLPALVETDEEFNFLDDDEEHPDES